MGILDEIKAEVYDRKKPSAVGRALEALAPEDREGLEAALAAPIDVYSHAAIARVLRKRGFDRVNEGNVGHYRKVMKEAAV